MIRRLLAVVVVVAAAVGLALLTWPQAVGLERVLGVAQLVALRGSVAVVAVVVAVLLLALALLSRAVRPFFAALATVLVVAAVAQVGVLAMRGIGSPGLPHPGADDLTVLSWNTLGGSVPPAEIARQAESAHADVVALPETGSRTAAQVVHRLALAGVRMTAHTSTLGSAEEARSTSMLIADTLGPYRMVAVPGESGVVPSVVAEPTGGRRAPVLVAVHTVSPVPLELSSWRHDIAWVAARCTGSNVVLAGDFNATLDHVAGLGTGSATMGRCRDAALATGNAAVGTWPTSLPALAGAPIDHVMATPDWRIAGFRVLTGDDGAGSDHRPVVARLVPAG